MPTTEYTIAEHRHRFAAWAAARASQRGLRDGKVECFVSAIVDSGLRDAVEAPASLPTSASEFDIWHVKIAEKIVASMSKRCAGVTYGHAAKAIAIYLKSMIVLGTGKPEEFVSVLHPPIDDILLKTITRDSTLSKRIRALCKSTKWTQLNADSYAQLIFALRDEGLDKPQFWNLERYWTITRL